MGMQWKLEIGDASRKMVFQLNLFEAFCIICNLFFCCCPFCVFSESLDIVLNGIFLLR